MNIAIFGASGATGKLLTGRCLAAGHTVTALIRNPDAFALRDKVRIIQGSAFDPSPISETLKNADAVLSALGAKSPFKKEDVLQRAIPLIVAAMQQHGPRRIVALGSAGALDSSLDNQPALSRWFAKNIIYKHVLKYPVLEQISQYNDLSHSTLDWTMLLPPVLTNLPGRGRYRIAADTLPRFGIMIARSDVADVMMQQLTNPQWLKKGVYITW